MPKTPQSPKDLPYPPVRFEDPAEAQAAAVECILEGRVDIFEDKVRLHGLSMTEAKAIVMHGLTRVSKEHDCRYEAFAWVTPKGNCRAAYEIMFTPIGYNLQIITAFPLDKTEDRFR